MNLHLAGGSEGDARKWSRPERDQSPERDRAKPTGILPASWSRNNLICTPDAANLGFTFAETLRGGQGLGSLSQNKSKKPTGSPMVLGT